MTPRKSFILEYHRLGFCRPAILKPGRATADPEKRIIKRGEWVMSEQQADRDGRKLLQEAR